LFIHLTQKYPYTLNLYLWNCFVTHLCFIDSYWSRVLFEQTSPRYQATGSSWSFKRLSSHYDSFCLVSSETVNILLLLHLNINEVLWSSIVKTCKSRTCLQLKTVQLRIRFGPCRRLSVCTWVRERVSVCPSVCINVCLRKRVWVCVRECVCVHVVASKSADNFR
jgi:hypothetical protein